MNNNKLSILFLLQKVRINKQGKCPIRCRITFNEGRQEFATGLFINPNHWNRKLQQAKPPNEDNNYINTQASLIKQKVNQAFLYLQINSNSISVDDVYKQYKGATLEKELGVVAVYNQYNTRIKKLIGIEIKMVTYNKYLESLRHLSSFIIWNGLSIELEFAPKLLFYIIFFLKNSRLYSLNKIKKYEKYFN